MNVSLFQAASALNANSRWQELIAGNLAASAVPGYKRQEISFAAVEAGLKPAPGAPAQFLQPNARGVTNFSPGEMKYTGVNTDVAVEGSGFFEVQLPSGAAAYTRDGEFHVNAQGQLVTKQGFAVLGENGPVQFDPGNGGPVSIAATGEVSQGSDVKGKLKLTDFNEPHLLAPVPGGFFLANHPNLQARAVPATSLRQGYLESSNVSSVTEMAHLITAMRMFEANQKVLQSHDERMGRAISELGGVS